MSARPPCWGATSAPTTAARTICAGRQRRLALRHSPITVLRRSLRLFGKTNRVHRKLSGCGTHIEHIVSVHDLFRDLVVEATQLPRSQNRTTPATGGLARDAYAQTV